MQKSALTDNKSFVYKITANELKDIVAILNKPSFDENFTMVNFDELSGKALVKLLEKIVKMIDAKTEYNFNDKTDENKAIFSDLLSILSYPESTDEKFINLCFEGDKQSIQRLIFYLLKNFEDFKQRAYLGKFLAPFDVPLEFLVDEEMRKLDLDFKELQQVFQNEHKELAKIKAVLPNKKKMEQKIVQLEAERDQLKVRISIFQQKADTKDPLAVNLMKELLNGTRLLRKEQEEENSLIEKLKTQKETLEQAQQSVLVCQQKYVDAQKMFGQEVKLKDLCDRIAS